MDGVMDIPLGEGWGGRKVPMAHKARSMVRRKGGKRIIHGRVPVRVGAGVYVAKTNQTVSHDNITPSMRDSHNAQSHTLTTSPSFSHLTPEDHRPKSQARAATSHPHSHDPRTDTPEAMALSRSRSPAQNEPANLPLPIHQPTSAPNPRTLLVFHTITSFPSTSALSNPFARSNPPS